MIRISEKIRHSGLVYIALLLLGVVTNSCSSTRKAKVKTIAPWVNGNWEGSAYQFNTNENWGMLLSAKSLKNSYIIDYPSLQCSGKWSVLHVTENRIELREKITNGLRYCVTRGKVVLEKNGDALVFKYYYPDDTTLNAKGQLNRLNPHLKQ